MSEQIIEERYKIVEPIGAGGTGTVLKAWDLRFDRVVAVKLLSQSTSTSESRARFEREAQAISSLKHRNIVGFYDYGITGDSSYLVMEYISGKSLHQHLRESKALNPTEALSITEQICDALSCAHANSVIHRDLKPSNVMLVQTPDGITIKLVDFGLAKILPESGKPQQKITEAGVTVGTVFYMSPEQCHGEPADARSDIYSLGCILHHCLTGMPPFLGEQTAVIMQKHVNEAIPPLELSTDTPFEDTITSIVRKAMAKNALDRYQTAADMRADILKLPGLKPAPSSSNRIDDHRKKFLGLGIAAIVSIVVILIVVAAITGFHLR